MFHGQRRSRPRCTPSCGPDVPALVGHRQVTDAHLLVLARRHRTRVLTFDAAIVALAGGRDIESLTV